MIAQLYEIRYKTCSRCYYRHVQATAEKLLKAAQESNAIPLAEGIEDRKDFI